MRSVKKLFVMFLAMAMVLGMAVTAFAANDTPEGTKEEGTSYYKKTVAQPGQADTVAVEIAGITGTEEKPETVTVTLYKIASADYANNSVEYQWVEGAGFTDPKAPSANEIATIANGLKSGTITALETITEANVSGSWVKNVNAGAYIAIITDSANGFVYNPIFLTATYNAWIDENGNTVIDLQGGAINVGDNYLYGGSAVVKREKPSIDKEITTDPNDEKTENGGKDDIVTGSLGDTIGYKVTPTMPSYPANAANKTFFVSDTMATGLTLNYNSLAISLEEDGPEVSARYREKEGHTIREYYYTDQVTGEEKVFAESVQTENGFNINFTYVNLISDETSGSTYTPVITYSATINENAEVGSDGNGNDVYMIYSKTPNEGSDWDTPVTPPTTGEEYDVETDTETVYTYQLAFRKTDDAETDPAPLAGAVFGIYTTYDATTGEVSGLIDTVTTNEHGYAVSSQVGVGTYYLKEITAPDGYSLNETVIPVEASWVKATTTTTTTSTDRKYTSEQPDPGAPQVGWLVKVEGQEQGVFKGMADYYEAEGKIYDASTKEEVTNVEKAYLASSSTTIEDTVTTIENQGAGTGAVLYGDITNTRLTALPSTGGIGTTIFTVAGCLIMVIAAGLFFASRRKSVKGSK